MHLTITVSGEPLKKVNFVQEVCIMFSGESELDFKQNP